MPKQELRLFRVFAAAFHDRVLEGYVVRTSMPLGKWLLLKAVSVHFSETSTWHLERSRACVWQCLPLPAVLIPCKGEAIASPSPGYALGWPGTASNHHPDLIVKMKIHPHQTCIIRINCSLQNKAKLWSLTMLVSWFFFLFWNEINGKIAPFLFWPSKPSFLKILDSPYGFLDSFRFCFISSLYSPNYWIKLVISLAFLKKFSLVCHCFTIVV